MWVCWKEEIPGGKAALYATLNASFNAAACHYSQLAFIEHDAMVKRVGLCLLQLLKNKYGTLLNEKNVKERMLKRNPLLDGLTPSQAYTELKDAVKAYA